MDFYYINIKLYNYIFKILYSNMANENRKNGVFYGNVS